MNKVYLLVLASCLIVLLTACPATVELECAIPVEQKALTVEKKKDSMTINIYVDGTPSMSGFVSNGANTKYMEAIRILDSSASTGWVESKTKINYFRFGIKSEPVSRDVYLSSLKAEFYDPSNPVLAVSQIDKVITSAEKDNISVIVTDLYQKGTDVTLVRNALREQYLRQGYAVGVLGIKSEFNGTIYDVGTQNTSFQYNTQGKSLSKFHPFYVVILGSYKDVTHYYEKLKISGKEKQIINDDSFVIFYPKLTSNLSVLDTAQSKPKLSKGIKRVAIINNGDVKLKMKDKKLIDLLTVENIDSEDNVDYKVDYHPLPYTLELDENSISSIIKVKTFDKKSSTFVDSTDSNLSKSMKLSGWSFNKKKIEFSASISTKNIASGVHFTTIDALPISTKDYKWWREWNSDEGSFDGSKTDNLLLFLRELQSITIDLVKNQKIIVGRFCYAIQKK